MSCCARRQGLAQARRAVRDDPFRLRRRPEPHRRRRADDRGPGRGGRGAAVDDDRLHPSALPSSPTATEPSLYPSDATTPSSRHLGRRGSSASRVRLDRPGLRSRGGEMSPDDTLAYEWRAACERAAVVVPGPDNLIAAGELLRATAYSLAGVACSRCNGFGVKTYGSTAVWTGGGGAQSLTEG